MATRFAVAHFWLVWPVCQWFVVSTFVFGHFTRVYTNGKCYIQLIGNGLLFVASLLSLQLELCSVFNFYFNSIWNKLRSLHLLFILKSIQSSAIHWYIISFFSLTYKWSIVCKFVLNLRLQLKNLFNKKYWLSFVDTLCPWNTIFKEFIIIVYYSLMLFMFLRRQKILKDLLHSVLYKFLFYLLDYKISMNE